MRSGGILAVLGDLKPESYPFLWVCSDHFIKGKLSASYDEANPDSVHSLKLRH